MAEASDEGPYGTVCLFCPTIKIEGQSEENDTSNVTEPVRSRTGPSATSTTAAISCAASVLKTLRSWPNQSTMIRVQCDNAVEIHVQDLAYIEMQQSGYLSLVSGKGEITSEATFEVEEVQAPKENTPRIFRLRNNCYQQYVLTGHVSGDRPMTVDGHEDYADMTCWTATKVSDDKDRKHQFKLQLHAPHIAKDWYFYVSGEEDIQFKLGQPKGQFHDIFQIECPPNN